MPLDPLILCPSAEQIEPRLPALAALLIDCVEGGASVGFMLPLDAARVEAFWRRVQAAVARGERRLLLAEDAQGAVLGSVQLLLDLPENQPHRAEVAKLLVHRHARGQGIGTRLLQALEAEARSAQRSVLVLDTVTDSDAHRLYTRHGWQRVGEIPRYALMPDGAPCSTTYFHKDLDAPSEESDGGRR
jgi:GNAT superfamily N-acetyltransferase